MARQRTGKAGSRKPRPWRRAGLCRDTMLRLDKCIILLKVHGIVNVACRQAQVAGRGLSKRTYYEMREKYPDFAEEADEAVSQCVNELEADGMACARLARKDPRYLPMLKFALQVKAGWGPQQGAGPERRLPGDQLPNRIDGGLAL